MKGWKTKMGLGLIAIGEMLQQIGGGGVPDVDIGIPTEAVTGLTAHIGGILVIVGGLFTAYGIAHKVDRARRD